MPLESTMICLDNSEWMRNGDYIPTRMEAQHDAANLLCGSKTNSNPESTVGVLTMAGKGPELLVSPTDDMGKILSSLHGVSVHGKTNFAAAIQIAQLALKHRRNKHGGQRIIIFVSSPIEDETKTLVKVGRLLKKNNVAADVVSMGETDENQEKLEEFIGAANSGDNCHLVTIPAGVLPSDVLISSPIVSGEAGGGGGGGGGGLAAGGGGEFGGAGDFGGVDPSMDPELAMALRVSMEEERARQEAASKATAEEEGKSAAEGEPAAAAAAAGVGEAGEGDAKPAAAAATTEEGKGAEGGDAAAAATDRDAMQVDADDDGGLLEQALAMSMMDGDEVENMRIAMEMSMAQDTKPPAAAAATTAEAAAQPPAPTPPPASAGTSANPPPAPGAAAAGADGGAGEFFDPSFVQSLLGQIPHVDPNDPRIQAAVDQAGATAKKE
ncbi:unnamed protein product, partial [Scytosiphon promiscuus]